MMSRCALLSLGSLWLAVALSAPAAGEVPPDPRAEGLGPSERVEALVERVRIEQQSVRSLEADFVQIRESELLVETLEARGVFAYRSPDQVRWDYDSPNPIAILITDESMITWYRDINQAERLHVGPQSQRVMEYLGAGSSVAELLEYFSITMTLPPDRAEPFLLELEPRYEKVARRIRGMTVWIDAEQFLPVRLRYVEADGDITDLRFANLRINTDVSDDRFELELPATVELRTGEADRPTGLH